ncbi:polysaccharide deacetylase family protein [Streptococcus moroccensis]|uniref:Peptidoglycan/xylan/chitin deacetylase (PgdA/CDA1 family) n=1 Tax=Streptococcus moroccensis TaxID=1451356 RepID=A0ABT9YSI1_9STRE|nr:polysaccharide deacetylase family protein [Streptococcus moroccensis]MDQ0222959.1 peptidoglycan/xylan/chitin deacetylase (PgdA/CDA1 family) [Streptococcus moroccensis]
MNRKTLIKKRRERANRQLSLLMSLILLMAFGSLLTLYFWSRPQEKSIKHLQQNQTKTTLNSSDSLQDIPVSADDELDWEKQDQPVQVPILMYHAIHIMDPAEAPNANLIVAPDVFESHLKALTEAGYYSLTPEEAYKVLTENVLPKGKKVVWLTFDDSLWDFYEIAYPILKKYQIKATNNVIIGTLGHHGHLSIEQLLEMKGNGMSFQAHTVNHPDLAISTIERQQHELVESKAYLDSFLEQDTISLAYPAGKYSPDTLAIAEAAGYKMATTTNPGLASLDNGMLTLNRVRIMPTTTAESLLHELYID